MDASKLINGSRAGVLGKRSGPAPKSGQPSIVPSEAKKVGKTATKKAKTERPQMKAIRKSKSEKLVCRYCGSDDLAPSFIKRRDRRCRKCFSKRYGSAARVGRRRSRSRSLKSMTGAGLEKARPLYHSQTGCSKT